MTPLPKNPGQNLEPRLWYPHYYSSLLRNVEKEKGRFNQQQIIPDIQSTVEKTTDADQRATLILLGCLQLGFNLGILLAKEQKPSTGAQRFAEQFSLHQAHKANLWRFQSNDARTLYKLFPKSTLLQKLFHSYIQYLQKEEVLRFLISEPKVSNAQLYQIINHSNRIASLLILLENQIHDKKGGAFFIEAHQDRYQQVFELKSVSVSSPGMFQLVFRKSYEWLKKYLPAVRTALKKLPLLDLYIEKEQTRLQAETDHHKMEQDRARLEKKKIALQESLFDEYVARLTEELPDSRLKEQLQNRLKESAQTLSEHGVKIPK